MCHRLHHIVSLILRDLYSIRPLSIQTQCSLAMQYSKMVQEWRGTLPSFLSLNTPESIPLIAIFQRQRDVLNISYWHALIIIYRPLLLRKFALVQRGRDDTLTDLDIESSVNECLVAALRVTEKVEEMFKSRMIFRSFWVRSQPILLSPSRTSTWFVDLLPHREHVTTASPLPLYCTSIRS
jgi:hypothetical protein